MIQLLRKYEENVTNLHCVIEEINGHKTGYHHGLFYEKVDLLMLSGNSTLLSIENALRCPGGNGYRSGICHNQTALVTVVVISSFLRREVG